METRSRRRRIMAASVAISAALHVLVLSLLFFAFRAIITPQGAEQIGETTTIAVEKRPPATPAPAKRVRPASRTHPLPVAQARSLPAAHPVHEIAKQIAAAPGQPRPRPRAPAVSNADRDRALFANEVAQLNRADATHAIPTIDPAAAQPSSKSYAFDAASRSGDEHGNGIITPVTSWRDEGRDCYYARYSYTYPSGAMESGNIVWPICFSPADDPFHRPPHPMPFPLPLAGYRLPADTLLPPLEKSVYEEWAAGNG